MLNFIRIYIFLSLLVMALPFVHANEKRQTLPLEQVSLSLKDEARFYQLIHIETNRILDTKKDFLNARELKGLRQVKYKITKIMKSLNLWEHFSHLMITHGKGVAVTSIISEVVTIFIIPPTFIAMGWNTAAAVIGGVPSPAYMIPAYIGAVNIKKKMLIGRELGLSYSRMLELDALRHDLIGFSIDHRVISIILKGLGNDKEINIIRRRFGRLRTQMRGPILEMFELEDLVKNSVGKHRFSLLKEFSSGDDAIFANMLLIEIDKKPILKTKLHSFLFRRLNIYKGAFYKKEHRKLFMIHEKFEVINRYRLKVRKIKSTLQKELKLLELTDKVEEGFLFRAMKEMTEVIKYVDYQLADLDILDHDIKKLEYRYMDFLNGNLMITQGEFSIEASELILRLKKIRSDINSKVYKPSLKKNNFNIHRLRNYIRSLKKYNSNFALYLGTKSNKARCSELLKKILPSEKIK